MKHYRQVTDEDQRAAVERASLGIIPDVKVIAQGTLAGQKPAQKTRTTRPPRHEKPPEPCDSRGRWYSQRECR
jgi:hypothetical protein